MSDGEIKADIGKAPFCRECGTRMSLVQRAQRIIPYEILTFECPRCKSVRSVTRPGDGRMGGRRFRVEERIAEAEFLIGRQQELISSGLAKDARAASELLQVLKTTLATLLEARAMYERRHIADGMHGPITRRRH